MKKPRNSKPVYPESRRAAKRTARGTARRTPEKRAHAITRVHPEPLRRAERAAMKLLDTATRQAKKGYPRLLAEIFRFLRPDRLTILQVKPRHVAGRGLHLEPARDKVSNPNP